MTPDEIEIWARRMGALGLAELEVEQGDARLVLRRAAEAAADEAAPAAVAAPLVLRAPYFGHLRQCHPQRGAPEAAPGAAVVPGQCVAFIEAGAVLHPVLADRSGQLAEWLEADGALVGYGAALAVLKP